MAKELQKMLDAKRQLLLAVSHELRSPLTRANVAIEMLQESTLKQNIKDDMQEIEDLIADILETERLHTPHHTLVIEKHSINDLCSEVIETYFPKNIIHFNLPKTDILASVDKPRVKLLLKNIISNALKYQTKKTTVNISTLDKLLLIQVTDDGQGIAKENIPHLTEPFYRVDPARQRQTGGYGLGLYLCRMIAEAHNGKLSIESELKLGTKVIISLPLSSEK